MATFYTPKRVQKETNKTVFIDKHDHAGNGLCLNTTPLVVVPNALAGETCQVKFTKQSKKVSFANVIKVLDPKPNRTAPFCTYYERCGGCSLQHTSAGNGLALKEEALKDFVAKKLYGRSTRIENSVWSEPIWSDIDYGVAKGSEVLRTAYRRRIRLAVDARNKSSVKIGFRAANTQKIIDIETCPVALRSINVCLPEIRNTLKKLPSINKIGHIVITQGEQVLQLALYVTHTLCQKSLLQLEKLAESSRCHVQICDKSSESISLHPSKLNAGEIHDSILIEDKANIKLSVQSNHFLQVNKFVNQQMLANVHSWLSLNKTHTLYDFFCGSGNFALAFAPDVRAAKGFEGISEMVKVASVNAAQNNITNAEFFNMDLSSQDELVQLRLDENAVVVLDPSREGASAVCEFLVSTGVSTIVYVSCNANSFVRDAAVLLAQYRLDKIKALDMFPFTKHLELMALFTKQ